MRRNRLPNRDFSLNDPMMVKMMRKMPDEILASFSFPLFSQGRPNSKRMTDEEGFPIVGGKSIRDLRELQNECWEKFETNPQISSHVRDVMGRMAGWGFGFSSQIPDIQKAIEEIMEDPRNDLYQQFPKFCGRSEIEGELYLVLTLHIDGFVEVDFISPSMIGDKGDEGSGIIFHPTKQTFPLFYNVTFDTKKKTGTSKTSALIPSINIARYPDELIPLAKEHPDFDEKKTQSSKSTDKAYKQFDGYFRFMIEWNKGYMTRRNVSHIRTTIEWVNYYEELKKYEIDHKKSSGAYLWVITVENIKSFRRWLEMTPEERKATGITEIKEPGGTIILPPGLNLEVLNPKLPSISEQDTDIMQMVSSGLQQTQDNMLGSYKSSYASIKAAQGPQSDRHNDELHYFKLFLVFSFWRSIFFLKSKVSPFKEYFYVPEVVDFKDKEPIKKKIRTEAYKLVDVCLPVSKLEDIEATARALLGTKHGSVIETMGIPLEEVAKRLGFYNYPYLRKKHATEREFFPDMLSNVEQESYQERREGEPKNNQKQNQNQNQNQNQKQNENKKKDDDNKSKK